MDRLINKSIDRRVGVWMDGWMDRYYFIPLWKMQGHGLASNLNAIPLPFYCILLTQKAHSVHK